MLMSECCYSSILLLGHCFGEKGCRPGRVDAVQGTSGVLREALVSPLLLWGAQPLALPTEHGWGVDTRAQVGDDLGTLCSPQFWREGGRTCKGKILNESM